MVCFAGIDPKACSAKKMGDCCVHPLSDATMFAMADGFSWYHISDRFERQQAAVMTEEQRAEAAEAAAAAAEAAAARLRKAAEEREAVILATRERKAESDAKDLALRFASNHVNSGARLCSWVKLQKEAEELVAAGAEQSALLKQLTPGRERITVKDALGGCFAHRKRCCPFDHGDGVVFAGVQQKRGGGGGGGGRGGRGRGGW